MKTELVTNLKRHATKILEDLHLTKEPVLITEHGRPSAYLVDVEDYSQTQQRLRVLEGIALGERSIKNGKTLSTDEAKERMSKWLK